MRKNILDLIAQRRELEKANGGVVAAATVLGDLASESPATGNAAALKLANDCRNYGITVRDYLDLSITPVQDGADRYTGYELALMELNLPVRDDFSNGMVLQAAAETFQTRSARVKAQSKSTSMVRLFVQLTNLTVTHALTF